MQQPSDYQEKHSLVTHLKSPGTRDPLKDDSSELSSEAPRPRRSLPLACPNNFAPPNKSKFDVYCRCEILKLPSQAEHDRTCAKRENWTEEHVAAGTEEVNKRLCCGTCVLVGIYTCTSGAIEALSSQQCFARAASVVPSCVFIVVFSTSVVSTTSSSWAVIGVKMSFEPSLSVEHFFVFLPRVELIRPVPRLGKSRS